MRWWGDEALWHDVAALQSALSPVGSFSFSSINDLLHHQHTISREVKTTALSLHSLYVLSWYFSDIHLDCLILADINCKNVNVCPFSSGQLENRCPWGISVRLGLSCATHPRENVHYSYTISFTIRSTFSTLIILSSSLYISTTNVYIFTLSHHH